MYSSVVPQRTMSSARHLLATTCPEGVGVGVAAGTGVTGVAVAVVVVVAGSVVGTSRGGGKVVSSSLPVTSIMSVSSVTKGTLSAGALEVVGKTRAGAWKTGNYYHPRKSRRFY